MLELCAREQVEAVVPREEVEKHSLDVPAGTRVLPHVRDAEVDFCIAIGGDGTILRAFNRFPGMQTPVLGINFGNVGFLAAIGRERIAETLAPFLRGEYRLVELGLLAMEHAGERRLAVNDVVVHKPDGGSVVRLAYRVDDTGMDSFNCDGMVVATPAGSTAYNLSNGGPLLSLALDSLVLTAIAPHTLSARPLVLSPAEKVTIENRSLGAPAALYLDGRHAGDLEPGGAVTVQLAAEKARLVQSPDADFLRNLRDKFIRAGRE